MREVGFYLPPTLPVKALRSEHGDRVTLTVGVWAALGVCKKYKDSITTARFGLPRGRPLAAPGMVPVMFGSVFYMFLSYKNILFVCKETHKGAAQDFALFSLLFRSASEFSYHQSIFEFEELRYVGYVL